MRKSLNLGLLIVLLFTMVGCNAGIINGNDANTNQSANLDNSKSNIVNDAESNISKPFIISVGNDTLMGDGLLLNINNNEVSAYNTESDDTISYFYVNSVMVGNTIYKRSGDSKLLNKLVIKDGKISTEDWVSKDTINNNEISTAEGSGKQYYARNLQNFKSDGNYVYFEIIDSQDFSVSEVLKPVAYRLGRISLDGNKIEFVGDIVAYSYDIYGDYIYYFDCGRNSDGSVDSNRVGIYKCKLDGSEKNCLYKDFEKDTTDYNCKYCEQLIVSNDNIYFIDYSANGKGRICSVDLNGSNYNIVSENKAMGFDVDDKNQVIYYSNIDNELKTFLNKKDINQNTDEQLFPIGRISGLDITCQEYDGCLYISDSPFNRYKYDIANKKAYQINQIDDKYTWEEIK